MKRIRKTNKKESVNEFKSHFFDTKGKIIGVSVTAVILLVLTIVLMFVENSYGKLIVKNNTDLDIDNVAISFVNEEAVLPGGVEIGAVSAGKTYSNELESYDLRGSESNLELHFTFAGYDELFTDVGYFNDDFKGNIKISFTKTEDPNLVKLHIEASNGIFKTNTLDCDDDFIVNLSEGTINQ